MNFVGKDVNNEKEEKINYIIRIMNDIKSHGKNDTLHCGDYSSVICLKCDKCWSHGSKGNNK